MSWERKLSPWGAYTAALVAFSVGTVAAWIERFGFDLRPVAESGWCTLMIVWFPFTILWFFRKRGAEHATLAAIVLSLIAGFDGVLRLYPHTGC